MRLDDRTDGELLNEFLTAGGANAGGGAAFSELVHRHGPMVRGVCRRTGAVADAEDVAQLVFVTLAERAPSLLSRGSLAGWLHRVAFNIASRRRRAAAVRRSHERSAGALRRTVLAGAPGPAAAAEREVIRVAVHRAIDALPGVYREALILHHLEGYTVAAAAERLRCPAGTVAARVSRGREMLRDRLDRGGAVLSVAALVAMLAEERRTLPRLARLTPAGGATGRVPWPRWLRWRAAGAAGSLGASLVRLNTFLNAPVTTVLWSGGGLKFAGAGVIVCLGGWGLASELNSSAPPEAEHTSDFSATVTHAGYIGEGGAGDGPAGRKNVDSGKDGKAEGGGASPGRPGAPGKNRESASAESEPQDKGGGRSRSSGASGSGGSGAASDSGSYRVVPEPTLLPVFGIAVLGMLARRRRRGL